MTRLRLSVVVLALALVANASFAPRADTNSSSNSTDPTANVTNILSNVPVLGGGSGGGNNGTNGTSSNPTTLFTSLVCCNKTTTESALANDPPTLVAIAGLIVALVTGTPIYAAICSIPSVPVCSGTGSAPLSCVASVVNGTVTSGGCTPASNTTKAE